MSGSVQKSFTLLDWENETIYFLNGECFLSKPNLNQRTTRFIKANLKKGEQDKIKAKQAEIFSLASNSYFEILKCDFARNFLSSPKPFYFLKYTDRFLENLFNGKFNNADFSQDYNTINFDWHCLGFTEKSLSEISNAYTILNAGDLDYDRYHPKLNYLFKVPVEDVFIETQGLHLFYKWLKKFKLHVDGIISCLKIEVGIDSTCENAGSYLNILAYCMQKDGIETILIACDKIYKNDFPKIENDFKYKIYFQIVLKMLRKSKKLIEKHMSVLDNFTDNKDFISKNLASLYFAYQQSNNLSREFRLNIEANQDFMEILKVNVALRNEFKNIYNKYPKFINKSIVVNKTYHDFEHDFLQNALSIDSIIQNCITPKHKELAKQSAHDLIVNISEDFEFAREVFLNDWLADRQKHNYKLTVVDYINRVLVYFEKNFFKVQPVNGKIDVFDSKNRPFNFNYNFFKDYVLPFFQTIKEELLTNLSKIKELNNISSSNYLNSRNHNEDAKTITPDPFLNSLTKSISGNVAIDKIKPPHTYFIINKNDEPVEFFKKKLGLMHEILTTKKVMGKTCIDSSTNKETFIDAIINNKPISIKWLWGKKDFRYLSFIASRYYEGTHINFLETGSNIFYYGDKLKFNPVALVHNNGMMHPDKLRHLDSAFKPLK